jgi:hypothetical protein
MRAKNGVEASQSHFRKPGVTPNAEFESSDTPDGIM